MPRLSFIIGTLAAVLAIASGSQVIAQRVQFPAPAYPATQPTYTGPPTTFAPQGGVSVPPPSGTLPYSSAEPGYGANVTSPPVWDPYAAGGAVGSPTTTPFGAVPPATTPYGQPPNAYGQPPATYGQPPTNPYPSYPSQPSSLMPGGSPLQWQPGSYAYDANGSQMPMQRLIQNVGFEVTWLPWDIGSNDLKKLGITTAEIWVTAAIPIFYNTETPLRVTPGFAVNWVQSPTPPVDSPYPYLLPSRLYDAYLDGAWEPRLTEWLSADLGVRVGVYSDMDRVTSESIRYMGRGLGVLSFTPTIKVALGVWYLDRLDVKLLPAGGVIYTPNPDVNYRILFPNPKLARRFTTVGTTEWWWYFGGEYGGGTWTATLPGGSPDQFDYNDLRAYFGLEWIGQAGFRGHVELGYVWDREVLFRRREPHSFKPDDTIMLRGGIDY